MELCFLELGEKKLTKSEDIRRLIIPGELELIWLDPNDIVTR